MQFWQTLLKNPSGEKSMDDFAISIDKIPKLVFSNTLKDTKGTVQNLLTDLLTKKFWNSNNNQEITFWLEIEV